MTDFVAKAARYGAPAVLVALAGTLALSASAGARSMWLGATDLSSLSVFADAPDVAADPEGEAIAVWSEQDGSQVRESTHPPDGAWQPGVTLGSWTWSAPVVEVDAAGDAMVAWGDGGGVEVSERPYGGSWQSPVSLGSGVGALQLAGDARGDALAIWLGSDEAVYVAARPAGGGWQRPVQLSSSGENASNPQVALDAQGDAVAVWQLGGGSKDVIQAAERPAASGVWQPSVTISSSAQGAGPPALAVDPAGEATALWAGGGLVESSSRPPGGTWQTPVDVSASGGADPQLALDEAGDAIAVWDQSDGSGNFVAEAARRPEGSAWQAPVAISAVQPIAPGPQVVADARGDAVAIWDDYESSAYTVQAAVEPAGGAWQAVGSLSSSAVTPTMRHLASDPQGNTTVIWSLETGTTDVVQAAGYDAAGPILDGLSIPPSGVVGEPVPFSVSPLDAWSAVASSAWSFGDGQTGIGQTLTHTYTRSGTYPVSITSADVLGNPTTTTGSITIAPASTSPKPTGSAPGTAAPALSRVSQTHRTWREGTTRATISTRRAPIGTTFAFTVDQAARMTLVFTQSLAGRRTAGKCRAPTRANRRHTTCRRTLARGSLSYTVRAGTHRVTFLGRIAGRSLPLGPYIVTMTATGTATAARSDTRALRFTIVP
jgi:PKD repeat protein